MTDEPTDQSGTANQPPPPAEPAQPAPGAAPKRNPNAAFLVLGIVFIVIAITYFVLDSMRSIAFAFLPVGVTFLILGMVGQNNSDKTPKS